MTSGDIAWLGLGWQLAVAVRFAADLLLEQRDRRKARRARAAETTPTP